MDISGRSSRKGLETGLWGLRAVRKQSLPRSLIFLLAGLAVALGLKLHYRQAGSGELAWMLAPTARLVSLASGVEFEFESGAGWINRSRAFVIAPPCAGINFLVILALSLCLVTLRERPGRHTLFWWAAAHGSAYGAAIIVNALRIILALEGPELDGIAGLDAAQQHRWAGVVTYLCGLWAAIRAWRRLCPRRSADQADWGNGHRRVAGRGWLWIPPAVYLAVALGIPLVRALKTGLESGFAMHGMTVAAGCLFVWGGLNLLQSILASR